MKRDVHNSYLIKAYAIFVPITYNKRGIIFVQLQRKYYPSLNKVSSSYLQLQQIVHEGFSSIDWIADLNYSRLSKHYCIYARYPYKHEIYLCYFHDLFESHIFGLFTSLSPVSGTSSVQFWSYFGHGNCMRNLICFHCIFHAESFKQGSSMISDELIMDPHD